MSRRLVPVWRMCACACEVCIYRHGQGHTAQRGNPNVARGGRGAILGAATRGALNVANLIYVLGISIRLVLVCVHVKDAARGG